MSTFEVLLVFQALITIERDAHTQLSKRGGVPCSVDWVTESLRGGRPETGGVITSPLGHETRFCSTPGRV